MEDQTSTKIPQDTFQYLEQPKENGRKSQQSVLQSNTAMGSKLFYDRKVKNFSCNIGDYVLWGSLILKKSI